MIAESAGAATAPGRSALVSALREPAAYPHPTTGGIEVRTTHISVVFLAGDRVYKLKRPVSLGFLDYSTLDRRLACCEAEVRLNRRLAPDVYLGIAPVARTDDGATRIAQPGELLDWMVVMRRLPDVATLEATLQRGAIRPAMLDAIAQRLATFHAGAALAPAGRGFGGAVGFEGALEENLAAIAMAARDGGIPPADAAAVAESTRVALAEAAPLIDARAEAGRVRECHGDLRLDHVYLFPDRTPPADLCIIDGIEFNDGLRYLDPVCDLAFLVMDLGVHGYDAEAERVADAWFTASGDTEGLALLPLYTAYRATVRAKVEWMRSRDPELSPAATARAVDLTVRHVRHAIDVLAV